MTQQRSFNTPTSARVCWCALAVAASGCGVDLSLGELEPAPNPPLVDDDSVSAAAPVYEDGIVPARIAFPEVSLRMGSGNMSATHNMSVGDMDGDGFDDLAMQVRDDISGAEYIHLRYGSARPKDGFEVLAFSESGARLVVRRDYDFSGVAVNGVHPVGDFDADGYADVFVQIASGDPKEHNGGYLLYGGPGRWEGIHELRAIAAHLDAGARAPDGADYPIYSFAAPGDIDGDGFADLAMTSPEGLLLEPGVYVFYGRAERLAAETSWSEAGLRLAFPALLPRIIETGRDEDGAVDYTSQKQAQPELTASGDIDGDGLPELLVAYTDLNGNGGAGDRRVIVIRGAATRSTGTLNLLELEPQITDGAAVIDTRQLLMRSQAIGDQDGDGTEDFVVWGSTGYLFYGSPELLSGPIDVSLAAATLPGVSLTPVGDRDGDGDDELMVGRSYGEERWPNLLNTLALSMLSGTRTRLSGNVEILPEPTLEDGEIYPDSDRRPYDVKSAGDLDNDGAAELITLSVEPAKPPWFPEGEPQIHIHYGVHVPPAAPDGPH